MSKPAPLAATNLAGVCVVLVGEVDHFLALLGDRHGGDDRVVFLGDQARDDAVPILHDELALEVRRLAQRFGDVDVEADELAVRGRSS